MKAILNSIENMQGSTGRSYNELIQKLNRFTKKYYLNQVIRGSLLFLGLVIFLFIVFSALEYHMYFSQAVRKALFFGFIGVASVSLFVWVAQPLMKWMQLGKSISHEKAAEIIGKHFPDVSDKLLNVLQLNSQLNISSDTSLLLASIDQKTESIKPIPFQKAIDLSKNKKYLKYAVPPVLLLLILLNFWPDLMVEGSSRIIKNNEYFEKPAPFSFVVMEADNLKAVQFSDYKIKINTQGELSPSQAYISYNDQTYQLTKNSDATFDFVLKNIKDDLSFQLTSGEVTSKPYNIDVLKKPQFLDMKIKAVYPRYINRKSEVFTNNGDVTIPAGTRLEWQINTKETKEISARFSSDENPDLTSFESTGESQFSLSRQFVSDKNYTLFASSPELPLADSMTYFIDVLADQSPSISVSQVQDTADLRYSYFTGKADDDYGLTKLNVVYWITDQKGKKQEEQKLSVQPVSGLFTQFEYLFSADSFKLNDGDEVSYYFEVWDNDAINGSKVAKTSVYQYAQPSLDDLREKEKENNQSIENSLKDNLEKTKDLKKDIKELREKFLNKKELNWQDKKDIEKLKEQQEEIRKALEEAKKQLQENMENQEKLSEVSEEIKEKQEKLQELMDEVMDDELKQLMDEINKLLEELQREESIEKMEDMEMSSQEMELEMDKMLEMFKQLEMEKAIQDEIEKLNELAKEQEELSEKTKSEEKSAEDLKKEQEELSKKFEEIQKELENLKEKNKELENPKTIEDTKDVEKEIKEEQKNSEEALDKEAEKEEKSGENEGEQEGEQEGDKEGNQEGDKEGEQNEGGEQESEQENSESQQQDQQSSDSGKKQASKSQKKAAQKMQEMAEQLQAGMQGGAMEQMGEDIEMIRQLLENILTLSFDEENLIEEFQQTNEQTAKYVELVQQQFKIEDDFSLVRDSLHALSKRNDQIQSYVMDKVADIEKNMAKSIRELEERQKARAQSSQQFAMTYLNDLAVMLSESMAQMQQQMSSMMPGQQMCSNPKPGPGSGSKPMDKITQGQGQMKEGLEKMMEKMKNGEQLGAEDFGKMAQQQAALRKMLRDMQKQNSERGENSQLLQEIIDAMNGMEKDLVNKQLTNEMLKRQEEIETRLLEAEKAERQREMDEKRESRTAEQIEKTLPPAIEAYLKERENQLWDVDRTSPELTPYYKRLVELYYQSLNK